MAEFCEADAQLLFGASSDFKGLCEPGWAVVVVCEHCGPIQVGSDGQCISPDCYEARKPGHGVPYEFAKDGPKPPFNDGEPLLGYDVEEA